MFRTPPLEQPVLASWEPNFSPALPRIALCFGWLFLLCLTLPSRSPAMRLLRLASFPGLALVSLPLTFNHTFTLGNPLRDLAMPTLTWALTSKAIEICFVYSSGGPRPIKPFLPKSDRPVATMRKEEYAEYEWREVEYPKLWSWARLAYALDVLWLKRVGTSLLLPSQGRGLEWSKKGLNDWAQHLKTNKCKPEDVPVHGPVRRFGQAEMPLWASTLQLVAIHLAFKWLYALATPSYELLDVAGLYVPISSPTSRRFWYSILPSSLHKPFTMLQTPMSAFDLPLITRLGMTLCLGGAVCLGPAELESIPLLFYRPEPVTSFTSAFERPITSPGLARLWARSWHAMSQRDYLCFATVMPFSHNQVMQTFYVFFWSGVQHSWMFARMRTPPHARVNLENIVRAAIDPGMMGFFLCQGAGILVEKGVLDALPTEWKKHRRTIGIMRRTWMYTVLAVPGWLFLDSLLEKGVMTKDVLDGFGFKALGLMLQGKKYELAQG